MAKKIAMQQRIKPPQKQSQALYSWRDEEGKKAYSNIGFPENGKYTEGKIEWY
jgi:hypothetical protein